MNPEFSETSVEPRNLDRIRRRAHAVLDGRVPARTHPVELALVTTFSAALLAWAVTAVVSIG